MPAPSGPGTPGFFAHGSAGGTPYTVLTSDWANAVQMEICNVITASGQTLSKSAQNQLLLALQSMGRIKLTAPLNLYVATTGNDANTGLAANVPFKTLQQAITVIINNYDLNGNLVTVNVANGTYTVGAALTRQLNGTVKFVGNVTTPTSCKIQMAAGGQCFLASNAAVLWVTGFALEGTHGTAGTPLWTTADVGLYATIGAEIIFENIAFGPMTDTHMFAGTGAWIGVPSQATKYSIYGGAAFHMAISNGSACAIPSVVATVTGNPTFSYFAYADINGFIWAPSASFTGAATGTRYYANNGSTITTNGGGANFFPGNVAGISTTGYYN